MYPQLTGEPNFILIGVAAVFGLIIIVLMYYSISFKNERITRMPSKKQVALVKNETKMNTLPIPIDNQGYYSAVDAATQSSTSNDKVSNSNMKQVFNVRENIYTLDDAPAVCGALGADLASVKQLIEAHKNGADWCNVGWTKDGLAAYPIQYSTWKTLQDNNPNKRNICGKPGINLSRNDPNLLYGVNCYGVKPDPKGNEIVKDVIMSDKQRELQKKIAEFQKNINSIGISPFQPNKWSA